MTSVNTTLSVFVFNMGGVRPVAVMIDLSALPDSPRPAQEMKEEDTRMETETHGWEASAGPEATDAKQFPWTFASRGKRVEVVLEPPADNAECPITLSPILTHSFDFMPPECPCFLPGAVCVHRSTSRARGGAGDKVQTEPFKLFS